MTSLRLVPAALSLTLALLLTACHTATGPRKLADNDRLAPLFAGRDLRDGASCAVVAFNTVVWSPEPQSGYFGGGKNGAIPAITRIPEDELRTLSDGLLHTFMAELTAVAGLAVMPFTTLEKNRGYHEWRAPSGNELPVSGLMLGQAEGQRVAPPGLKFLPLAGGELDRVTDTGSLEARLERLLSDDIGRGRRDLYMLCRRLGVDFVIVVNNLVGIELDKMGEWQPQLELFEVAIVGKSDADKYALAQMAEGAWGTAPDAADAVRPAAATTALLGCAARPEFPVGAYRANRWWRGVALPYAKSCALFGRRLRARRR